MTTKQKAKTIVESLIGENLSSEIDRAAEKFKGDDAQEVSVKAYRNGLEDRLKRVGAEISYSQDIPEFFTDYGKNFKDYSMVILASDEVHDICAIIYPKSKAHEVLEVLNSTAGFDDAT